MWPSFLRNAVILGLLAGRAWARIGDQPDYPLVERSLQTQQITAEELEEFMLTFSFNSPPKVLERFWIDLFETDGGLPSNSTQTIEKALRRFLMAEMNAAYTHDEVKEVEVNIISQSAITSSTRRWRRGLSVIGSELYTELSVTFHNEPSPDKDAVEETVSTIMSNLTTFISNLTLLGAGDEELADINRAERKEEGGFQQGRDFDDDFVPPEGWDGAQTPETNQDSDRMPLAILMTVIAGAFVVLSSVALFSIRNMRKPKHVDETQNTGLGQINVFLGDESEDDLFSFEAALIESPAVSALSRVSASTNTQSQISSESSERSDLFGGIDSQLTSPRESKSIFSFLSGQKSESSSTVVVSNRTKDKESQMYTKTSKTPKPPLASLLTFSEEEESDESSEDAPLVVGSVLKPPKKTGQKYKEISETNAQMGREETTKVLGVARVKFANEGDSKAHQCGATAFAAKSTSTNSTETTQPREPSPPASSFHPRWFDVTFPSDDKDADSTEVGIKSSISADTSNPSLGESSSINAVSDSRVASLNEASDAGSTEAINLAWDNPAQAANNAAKAAEFVRTAKGTSPKTSPKKVSSPKSPKSPKTSRSTQPSPAGSPGFSPGGRRKSQKGRRHAKSTSADGSRNYQHETMQQKDESLASFDAVSLSDSDASPQGHQTPKTPKSAVTTPSADNKSFFSLSSDTTTSSDGSASKRLLNDLVWLEKKIAGAAKNSSGGELSDSDAGTPRQIEQMDSLSFASNDLGEELSIHSASPQDKQHQDNEKPRGVSAIVCRDCFAPPGKLRIVIHSTKDGPAIHTVKEGSSLTDHVYPGDLIISVDDVDTRSFTAEQVMKMMTARNKYQRKITVLHFESESKKK